MSISLLNVHYLFVTSLLLQAPLYPLHTHFEQSFKLWPLVFILYFYKGTGVEGCFCLILAGIWHWKFQSLDGCHRGSQC